MFRFALILLFASTRVWAAPEGGATDYELIERGWRILEEASEGNELEALVVFDLPLPIVFHLLSQTERQREFRPELRKVETIARGGDGHIDEKQLRVMFVKITYRIRYQVDPAAHRITWTLDPTYDNAVEQLDGSWQLYPLDHRRTVARFVTVVAVGGAVPGFMQDEMARRKLPGSLKRTREWVNSNGTGGR